MAVALLASKTPSGESNNGEVSMMKLFSLRGVLEFKGFQPLRHLLAGDLLEYVQVRALEFNVVAVEDVAVMDALRVSAAEFSLGAT